MIQTGFPHSAHTPNPALRTPNSSPQATRPSHRPSVASRTSNHELRTRLPQGYRPQATCGLPRRPQVVGEGRMSTTHRALPLDQNDPARRGKDPTGVSPATLTSYRSTANLGLSSPTPFAAASSWFLHFTVAEVALEMCGRLGRRIRLPAACSARRRDGVPRCQPRTPR